MSSSKQYVLSILFTYYLRYNFIIRLYVKFVIFYVKHLLRGLRPAVGVARIGRHTRETSNTPLK